MLTKTNTEKTKSGSVWSYVAVFALGILLAANIFFVWAILSFNSEIAKLKADDLTLAQAINNLSQQLSQATGGQYSGPMIETNNDYNPIK